MTSTSNLEILNTAKHQQHPFHVLGSSRLPIFMATFVGGLALSVIVKLQNVSNLSKFLTIGEDFLQPFFNLASLLPSFEIPDFFCPPAELHNYGGHWTVYFWPPDSDRRKLLHCPVRSDIIQMFREICKSGFSLICGYYASFTIRGDVP